jgi:ferric-dicitrate binding protein FerR (iron transport regulator)
MDDKNIDILEEICLSGISASDKRRFDKNKAYQRFLARTGKAPQNNLRRIWCQTAAAVAALVIVSYVSFLQGGKQASQPLADINVEVSTISIEASWGSRVKTYLPDGTLVWLNASSKLTCSQGFGINDRKVHLSGEGYFEVTPNENIPFSIQTDELQVSVLGTKFNLRNYPDDSEAMVSLLEGKVQIENYVRQGEDVIIQPDQKALFDKKNGDIRLTKTKASNDAEWTNGYLYFDEELLPDIAKTLERSYNVKIAIHPDLAAMRFYGIFVREEQSIKDILDLLASTRKVKYTMNGKEVIFNPK